MDQFIVSIILDPGAAIVASLVAIALGGVAAALLMDVKTAMRRVSYLCVIALLGLALTLSQLIWILMPAAADAGMIGLLAVLGFAFIAAFGAGTYFASAARSRDICGEARHAWMGFIPFVNLWLMFKQGQEHDARIAQRRPVARYVVDPLLVTGACLLLVVTQTFDKATQDVPLYDVSDSAALQGLVTDTLDVEDLFAAEAEASGALLPLRIDNITVMSNIQSENETLTITYDVERDLTGLAPDFRTTLATLQCSPDMFGSEISRGGTVRLLYRAPDGRIIEDYSITRDDCVS